jgi:hypothetical protein
MYPYDAGLDMIYRTVIGVVAFILIEELVISDSGGRMYTL